MREGEDAYCGYGSARFDLQGFRSGVVDTIGIGKEHADTVTPIIIPPALGKTGEFEPIPRQWREAIKAIGKARHLWIVGYSFPDTDVFMSRLLTEGLVRNQELERVIIVNIEPETNWSERLRRLFPLTFRRQYLCYVQARTKNFLNFLMSRDDYKSATDVLFQGGCITENGEFQARAMYATLRRRTVVSATDNAAPVRRRDDSGTFKQWPRRRRRCSRIQRPSLWLQSQSE